jgi:DNA-binding response OmpR family regulator
MTKILVAEDERDIRELIAFTLRYAGYEVSTAANGEVALAMARQEIPDLIIMDVRMPRMTGYDACREIKAGASTQHIPVVFLSAKGQEAEIQSGLDVGAQEYILKPFSPEQLTEVVREILSKNRRQSAQR